MPLEVNSDPGFVKHVIYVIDRVGRVDNEYQRAGKALQYPLAIQKAFSHINDLQKHHLRQDRFHQRLTHTNEQFLAVRDVGRWLMEKHHELKGTPCPDPSEWENF